MREQGAGQAPSKRIQQLKERLFSEPRCVSIEQARIVTRVYREHPDLPVNILRAKAFATALEEITLRIDPGELIVGNRTAGIRAGVIFPESGLKWVEQEIETLPTRPQDRFEVTQEDIAAFRNEILPFWRGRTLEDVLEAKIGDEMRESGKNQPNGPCPRAYLPGHPHLATARAQGLGGTSPEKTGGNRGPPAVL